jgi:hypothetical protein
MTTDAQTDAWVKKTLSTAKPLTAEQRAKLAELLKPVRRESGTS